MEQPYLGNPNLKKANVAQEWTQAEVEEYAKCMNDPMYFIQQYIKIVSLDEGLVPFTLYDFQKEMIVHSIIIGSLSANFLDSLGNRLLSSLICCIMFYSIPQST